MVTAENNISGLTNSLNSESTKVEDLEKDMKTA